MTALTSSYVMARERRVVPAPEIGEGVEIVVAEVSALEAEEFRQFAVSAKGRANGHDIELGIRGYIKLLKSAIIDPGTGRPTFSEDQLAALITPKTTPAFHRAFIAAVELNGYEAESAEGNVDATQDGASLTSSP